MPKIQQRISQPFCLTVGLWSAPLYLPWLRHLLSAISRVGGREGLSTATQWRCTVALIEAVNNAIVHAHRGVVQRPIWLSCSVRQRCVRLAVCDSGPPFRLGRVRLPAPDQIRGRGLYLMRTMMHGVRLRRRRGHNILELVYDESIG